MTWFAAGAALVGAGLNYYGSTQATNAGKKAGKKNQALAQQQYYNSLAMLEPNRSMGYQAGADLSHLYGWSTPGYTPYSALANGGVGGSGGLGTAGSAGSEGGGILNPNNVVGFGSAFGGYVGGAKQSRYGGSIDPATGTVDVANGHSYQDQALTNYLRTGEWTLTGKKSNDLKAQIDKLRASGWTYDPATGKGTFPGQVEGTPAGEPGQMDRFFTSPDYQYTFDQAIQGNDRSAAARGGALSGNAITRNTETAGALGAGQYQNYVNNLFRAMGYGQNATQDTVNSVNTYVNQQGALNQQMGDIRATGIANQYGAAGGLLNSLGSIYGNYMGSRTPSSTGASANSFSPNYGFTDMQLQPWSTF